MDTPRPALKSALSAVIALIALSVLMSSWYTVDEGERMVILRNGAAIDTAEPGLHFKIPVIDRAVPISVQTLKVEFGEMASYSKDQQPAEIRLSVNFHVLPSSVQSIYSTYGSVEGLVDRILRPRVNDSTKKVFGQFTAVSVIQDRAKFGTDVYQAVVKAVGDEMIIESIQIENIDFSNAYEQSIEQRMLAEVEVQKVKQNWEKEKVSADITRTRAQAEADARLAQATAEAKSIELRGQAEAAAIHAKGAALRDNPALVQLIQAEKWDGKLPTTMVPSSAVPFIGVK
ncbi:MAG: prohibitin family protein [Cellvibrionales bacterium]|jgi:regulator of protease activity HflC (stomatin/prohibitin superfamily)|nr:prohibitin family protein [Cellvibrionales bacterium]MBK8676591.1 prohibitin family protein [Cellvibrionales bacterium]TXH50653.1 MAG: prohibitin family protein [Cellvibrionales bacterium]